MVHESPLLNPPGFGQVLEELDEAGETEVLCTASDSEMATVTAMPSQCHLNVALWVKCHPSDLAVQGWLREAAGVFAWHWVVHCPGDGGFVDITPRLGGFHLHQRFISHAKACAHFGQDLPFEEMSRQIIGMPMDWPASY